MSGFGFIWSNGKLELHADGLSVEVALVFIVALAFVAFAGIMAWVYTRSR